MQKIEWHETNTGFTQGVVVGNCLWCTINEVRAPFWRVLFDGTNYKGYEVRYTLKVFDPSYARTLRNSRCFGNTEVSMQAAKRAAEAMLDKFTSLTK